MIKIGDKVKIIKREAGSWDFWTPTLERGFNKVGRVTSISKDDRGQVVHYEVQFKKYFVGVFYGVNAVEKVKYHTKIDTIPI